MLKKTFNKKIFPYPWERWKISVILKVFGLLLEKADKLDKIY